MSQLSFLIFFSELLNNRMLLACYLLISSKYLFFIVEFFVNQIQLLEVAKIPCLVLWKFLDYNIFYC